MVLVFTAALGLTDTVRAPHVVDPTARYVCFTDQATVVAPYELIRVDATAHPQRESRRYKILADHPILRGAEMTLWHDASYVLQRTVTWVSKRLQEADLVALRHPRRGRIEDEALAIARYGYVTPEGGQAHVARYRAEGFLDNVLTASGLIGRRSSPVIATFNALWWEEIQAWGGRDQGSLDYAAWRTGVRVSHVNGTIRHNTFAGWRVRGVA